MATTTATATATATVDCLQQQQQQQQKPLRGISIIIEAEQAAQPATSNGNSSANVAGDEMSLKSQSSMLLAFGDNSNSNGNDNGNGNGNDDDNGSNLETLHVDHATKVDLETSYDTTTATKEATTARETATTATATKLYPQLLLRIGQSEAEVEAEAEAAAGVAVGAGEMAPPAATIISCNVADDVRNVLREAAAAGEIEESQAAAAAAAQQQQQSDVASQLMLVDWTTTTSAVTETTQQQQLQSPQQHTVKIQIANGQAHEQGQGQGQGQGLDSSAVQGQQRRLGKQISVVKLNDSQSDCEMVLQLKQHQQQQQQQQQHQQQLQQSVTPPYQLCYLVSSGQYSPCETLDSGTGSDLESIKSPDSNSNTGSNSAAPKLELHLKTTRIRVNSTASPATGVGAGVGVSAVQHSRAYSLTDSEECDESSSSLSCDSLHSNEAAPTHKLGAQLLPSSLLRDLRQPRDASDGPLTPLTAPAATTTMTTGRKIDGRPLQYEADQFYNFHVNEHANYRSFGPIDNTADYATHGHLLAQPDADADAEEEDAFVGYRDVRRNASQVSTIRSSKGTVRGVKNRVRNGVATFLQLQQPNVKNYKEKDVGKVVLYTTSMGIIRDTYGKCANVKQILRTLLIKFEERDVFMSLEYQQEMRDRMQQETIRVPQLFVEGQLIGDAETVERLNESGELRQLLRPYKSIATAYTCQTCGGFRLLPCSSCNGSKKSVHRNHFTAEFVALKCMNCDEVGLVKCPNC